MKAKAKVKIAVDSVMIVALMFLMGYQVWGETAHECVGVIMFVLFISHHILNIAWHKSLFKGKYNIMRSVRLINDLLILAVMLMLMYSGIVMSHHVFSFLQINGGVAVARKLHMLGSYWGFVLMSIHLGFHWNVFVGLGRRLFRKKFKSRSILLFCVGLIIACYGAVMFIHHNISDYLLLRSEFVLIDYSEMTVRFYIDYASIMGLFIFVAHYLSNIIGKCCKKKNV